MEQLWSAKFRVSTRPMKRHEWWRLLYREDRYGQHLTQPELRPTTAKIHLPMSKDFRYAYQDEYRFVWETPDRRPLSHVDLALGSLHDIAELVLL